MIEDITTKKVQKILLKDKRKFKVDFKILISMIGNNIY